VVAWWWAVLVVLDRDVAILLRCSCSWRCDAAVLVHCGCSALCCGWHDMAALLTVVGGDGGRGFQWLVLSRHTVDDSGCVLCNT
jgi:hypothetical protein